MLSDPLKPLADYHQFILYKLVFNATTGKMDKIPVNPATLITHDPHDSTIWCTYDHVADVLKLLDNSYGIAFVFTEADPFFFLDIDHCWVNDQWSQTANYFLSRLQGAAVEVSQSGEGLHVFGKTSPVVHGCKNTPLGLELYTSKRFVALTDINTTGNVLVDCTAVLAGIINEYFPPGIDTGEGLQWSNTPVAEWSGIADDAELIKRACASSSAKAKLGHGATFNDLWTNNIAVLSVAYQTLNTVDPYDRSAVDAAIAQHLAFWTGKNHERIRSIMLSNPLLVRDKWTSNKLYLTRTITNAVNNQVKVHQSKAVTKIDSGYHEIISMLKGKNEKLTTEETTQIVNHAANTTMTVVEKAEIIEQLKKRSSLGSIRNVERALREQRHGSISGVNHPQLAQAVIQSLGVGNVIFSMSYFWIWKDGVWVKSEGLEIRQAVQEVCQYQLNGDFKKTTIDSIFDITRTALYKAKHRFNTKDNIINVLNGELHCTDGKWLLCPHNRENYFTTQLPITYDVTATAPRFAQFLNEIFAGDLDAQDKTKVMLDMMGYTLLSTCEYERFIMLVGNGANGKSVLLDILESLLGVANVCAVQPSKLDNSFQRAHLHGKLANLITEVAEGEKMADAQIKAIVSGDLTTAEHKNKSPFDFHPKVTCWFATNHLPYTRDFSDALFRRAIILEFNNQFIGEKSDPQLIKKLRLELPGILNMALTAISGVLNRGSMSICESSNQAICNWRLESHQVTQFVEERCMPHPGAKIDISNLYYDYLMWARISGIRQTVTINGFARRLDSLGYPSHKGTNGARQRVGIILKQQSFPGIVTRLV